MGDAGSIEWGIDAVEWSCPPCDPIIRFGFIDVVEDIKELIESKDAAISNSNPSVISTPATYSEMYQFNAAMDIRSHR